MIDRIKISNYRCFREVDVPLKPLTVLIGPNNAGKTAFLSAINLLQDPSKSLPLSDHWMLQLENDPAIVFDCEAASQIAITAGRTAHNHRQLNWRLSGDPTVLTPIRYFGSDSLAPSMTSPGVTEKEGVPEIDNEVKILPAYLDSLLRRDRSRFDRILNTLKCLIPGLEDLSIATPDAGHRRIDLVLENGLTINSSLASYGVKLLIFFVALANHPSPPKVVLLEEPENGVHPKRLRDIVDLLTGLTEARFAECRTQVILTTHSPYLLDFIDISKSQVLVAQRREDGSRDITPVSEERLSHFLREFMLGEVWLNQGEAGLLQKEN